MKNIDKDAVRETIIVYLDIIKILSLVKTGEDIIREVKRKPIIIVNIQINNCGACNNVEIGHITLPTKNI